MRFTRSYLISFLLGISVVNEIGLPLVNCQDQEGSQCIPKKTFLALLRLPEVSSSLAAYSRTARVIQDAKGRNDFHLKALSSEEGDDGEICIPASVYLELFRDLTMRGNLNGRTQKLPEFVGRFFDESDEVESREPIPIAEAEKRSIATLAKNDDLPISLQDRNNDDESEKRSVGSGEISEALLRMMLTEELKDHPELLREFLLPNGELDLDALDRSGAIGKRNVATLARDFALPPGRRNIASLARDYGLPNGKRNIGALARDRMLPYGKRNVAALARLYTLPQTGKRNIASLARDYSLPYGKRYLGSLARSGDFPRTYDEGKRSVASLARNSDFPFNKRSASPPGSLILRILTRHGRSLNDDVSRDNGEPLDLMELAKEGRNDEQEKDIDVKTAPFTVKESLDDSQANNRSNRRMSPSEKRPKRQIDFSDEYPLPVMQNANVFDYEEMMEALAGQYPNAEKRFMGGAPEIQADLIESDYTEMFPPSKRHIAALARQGWLPSFRAARFSRSPRYLNDRENSADGPSTDYTSNPSAWPLRYNHPPRTRYLHGDCRHGFKRFLQLPHVDNFLRQKLNASPRSM